MNTPRPPGAAERLRALGAELDTVRHGLMSILKDMGPDQLAVTDLSGMSARLVREVNSLHQAAGDLGRLAGRPLQACESALGCCPEHGATLEPVTGHGRVHARCRRPDCRTWPYDRLGESCDQPATHLAVAITPNAADEYGQALVCVGHATQLIEWGWSVSTCPGDPGSTPEQDERLHELCRRAARRLGAVTAAAELVTGLGGYDVRDVGEGVPSYGGVFMAVNLRVDGHGVSAVMTFTHDHLLDVFVFAGATMTGVAVTRTTMRAWPAFVELLADQAGAEAPAVVRAGRRSRGSEIGRADLAEAVQDTVTADGTLLLEAIADMVRQVRTMGYTVAGQSADPEPWADLPHRELDLEFSGHGRTFGARMRYEPSVRAVVFAGGWEMQEPPLRAAPRTWSAWAGYAARLREVAEAGAELG